MNEDTPRLIEHAFPLKQASLDSVHEKNVRHGHISTLHIWPARRPLAACRAALIATLLPDPGTPEKRKELCEKIGGKVTKKLEKKKMPNGQLVEREKEVTEGGILHWGRETENKKLLDWFRGEIKKAYGGRAPKVLDPFAGGGAIPLEAMRLGCEATAVDINPVAWFILKCTLEYPQKLAGKTLPLPDFILDNEEFMQAFYKAHPHLVGRTKPTKKQLKEQETKLWQSHREDNERIPKADLAWHVRAWGYWVLDKARRELAKYYPTYAEFEPIDKVNPKPYEKQPIQIVPLKEDGTADIDALNKDFTKEYLAVKGNPRWIAKPTVAYLWARTVTCKNCRATIPLLKTRWLCKKDKKRVLLTLRGIDTVTGTAQGMTGTEACPTMEKTDLMRKAGEQTVGQAPADCLSRDAFLIYKRKLPHWRMDGATYFLTWRLNKRQEELRPEERQLIISVLRHFDGTRYNLHAYVVMNDHVHVIVEPIAGSNLSNITHSWKSFTANQLQTKFKRQGAIWQDESFDRIVRDEAEYLEKAQYINNNPFKRWPDLSEYEWIGFPHWQKQTGTEAQNMTGTEACPTSINPDFSDVKIGGTGVSACSVSPMQIVFGIDSNVPIKGDNTAQRREHDKRIGAGTMSRSGAKCPCCPAIMTMEDIRLEGQAGRLGAVMTAVVVDGLKGKEYRLPAEHEITMAAEAEQALDEVYSQIPFGIPDEPLPSKEALGFRIPLYGFDQWKKLHTPRQLLTLGTFVKCIRFTAETVLNCGYSKEWADATNSYLTCGFDRMLDFTSNQMAWIISVEAVRNTFGRYALPITWDYSESATSNYVRGGWLMCLEAITESLQTAQKAANSESLFPQIIKKSAVVENSADQFDIVLTDPPYYDAISYSDLMDYFYVWLRRLLFGQDQVVDNVFNDTLGPKWSHAINDGELIDDSSRHNGDKVKSKAAYEEGMAKAFQSCHKALNPDGRLVIVFAHKQPDAWETLVSAIIRAGFVVDSSWPIQTEQAARMRAQSSSALSSSVWLVCKKRPAIARPGWDTQVLEEMRHKLNGKKKMDSDGWEIPPRLHEYWDAGIRGPDFVWAATGPALEAYSKHPVVKKANNPGQIMQVREFLNHVRRMVVDFVVGRVLSGAGGGAGVPACHLKTEACPTEYPTDNLDSPTAYYLLHRNDFGLDEAPAGACILYAISCGISDKELAATWDLISFTKGKTSDEFDEEAEADTDEEAAPEVKEESGSKVKLKPWAQRRGRSMGYDAPGGKPVPLIDRVHRLMHLWKEGDSHKVDEYLDDNGLRRHELFRRLLQSLIELSLPNSEERSLLESLSNHVQAKGSVPQMSLALPSEE